ncbi:Intraflagellar transport protein 27 [Coelomomyces lativittatus]|nr:Intraflagellar transport protein 27 [Coelomomyces lativittatus]KAJ1515672.1 Intraflagellar transport protein 27 [Coelomomyces lativittatus]KAJ1516534.1 Intraflagellar transport protein 27 [Coelomomyces lativittatus]
MMMHSKLCVRGKIVLLGESGCGKSALVKVFHAGESSFPKLHNLNTSAELYVKKISIPDTDVCVELFIFDMPGHEAYTEITEALCQGAASFFLIFDVTNKDSFAKIGKWLQLIKKLRSPESPIIGCMVGTKNESEKKRAITRQQAKDAAASLYLEYFECSSLEGQDINYPFFYVANALFESYEAHLKSVTVS